MRSNLEREQKIVHVILDEYIQILWMSYTNSIVPLRNYLVTTFHYSTRLTHSTFCVFKQYMRVSLPPSVIFNYAARAH